MVDGTSRIRRVKNASLEHLDSSRVRISPVGSNLDLNQYNRIKTNLHYDRRWIQTTISVLRVGVGARKVLFCADWFETKSMLVKEN